MQYALIFTGGDHPPREVFERFIQTFYPRPFHPLIIAADSGLHCAECLGYTPDIIIGDMDSISPSRLAQYPPAKRMVFERDKDETDTVLALEEAIRRGADTLLLCGGDGGRIDHLLGIVRQFERNPTPDCWLCREQVLFYLRSNTAGKPAVLELPAALCREYISVFPVPSKAPFLRLRSEGLKWPLDRLDWETRGFSLSNRSTEAYVQAGLPVRLTAESGNFLAAVPYDSADSVLSPDFSGSVSSKI